MRLWVVFPWICTVWVSNGCVSESQQVADFYSRISEATCDYYFRCCNAAEIETLFSSAFTSKEQCRSYHDLLWEDSQLGLQLSADADDIEVDDDAADACISAIDQIKCGSLDKPLGLGVLKQCTLSKIFVGQRSAAEACNMGYECDVDHHCASSSLSKTGIGRSVCVPKVSEGGSCAATSIPCAEGLACRKGDRTCQSLARAGESCLKIACDTSVGLYCRFDTKTASAYCLEQRDLGDDCSSASHCKSGFCYLTSSAKGYCRKRHTSSFCNGIGGRDSGVDGPTADGGPWPKHDKGLVKIDGKQTKYDKWPRDKSWPSEPQWPKDKSWPSEPQWPKDMAGVPDKLLDQSWYWPDQGKPNCSAVVIGKPCTKSGGQCGAGHTCLLTTATVGICTCPCTPDNRQTPLVDEDTCPGFTDCSNKKIETTSGGTKVEKNYCFKRCTPKLGTNECTSPYICHPLSSAALGLWSKAYCYYSMTDNGCASNSDCNVTTGGRCSSTKSCPLGTKCVTWTGTSNGMCAKPGICDTTSGLCKPHTSGKGGVKIGAPCKGDIDCGHGMACFVQHHQKLDLGQSSSGSACTNDGECCSGSCTKSTKKCATGPACGVRNRNGYCTIQYCSYATTLTHAACPSGSYCNHWYNAGMCQKTCDLKQKSTCRGHNGDKLGDYECRSWDKLYLSATGKKIAMGPVCDLGHLLSCGLFSGTSLTCSIVGLSGNSTNMTCRDLKNSKLSKHTPTGLCLDDTASGPVQ